MFIINQLKTNSNIIIKENQECSTFFLELFQMIDEKQLCELQIIFPEVIQNFDFSYDFLSIYDFLPNFVKFINSTDVTKEFTLLLYERGEDKIVIRKEKDNNIHLNYILNVQQNIKLVLSVIELNNIMKNLIANLRNVIFSNFTFKKNNCFDKWVYEIEASLIA